MQKKSDMMKAAVSMGNLCVKAWPGIKKTMILITVMIFMPVSGLYAIFHLGVNAGYSYSSMDDMKAGFKTIKYAAIAAGKDAKVGDFGPAVYANVDLDFGTDLLTMAARTGLQYVLPIDVEINDAADPTLNTKVSYSAFLVPFMMGVNLSYKLPDNTVRLSAAVHAGYGVALSTQTYAESKSYLISPQTAVYDSIFLGGGFMCDGSGSVEFDIFDFLTIGLNIGYRYAKFTDMKAVSAVELNGQVFLPSSQIVTTPPDETRSANFSGFTGGLGFNFRL